MAKGDGVRVVGWGLVCGVLGFGCWKAVKPPSSPALDKPPVISISAQPTSRPNTSGPVGDIEKQAVTGPGVVNVDLGTRLLFTASAANPGGVKSFSLTIKQNGATVFTAATSLAPDANGNVSDGISILGVNGSGGAGPQAMNVDMDTPVVVDATAENYNGQATTYQVTYAPIDSKLRKTSQQQTLTLHRVNPFGLFYTGTFPSVPASGDAVNLEYSGTLNYITVARKGQTEVQCQNDPSPIVVYNGSRLFDLTQAYGAALVPLAIDVGVCVSPLFASTAPSSIDLKVDFTLH
jgi:hypothetical protein